ncbi:MAG TPA: MBL fold metallo-hydrolase [Terriglobia bacterium]|jgi:phosphoribosyl 1,2-cyclic phosphate phosphodiesterase|nr:MBL fold metallo-hydrolase [Terriglobia bacterium]
MRLTFLGTGTSTGVPTLTCECPVCLSSDPRDKRTRPSVLLEYDGRAVVIDTTPDFRQQALRARMRRLDAVVFTHEHADHILGLDDVRVFYFRQHVPIPIYADSRTMESIRRVYKYIFDQSYAYGGIARLDPQLIDGPFDLWGERLIPVPVVHGDLPVLGFRFGHAAYVTDFSAIPEPTLPLLEDLDVLILDALRHKPHPTHSSVEQSLGLVERVQPRRAFFTHIAHELGHEETNATLPPHVRLAYDGLVLDL